MSLPIAPIPPTGSPIGFCSSATQTHSLPSPNPRATRLTSMVILPLQSLRRIRAARQLVLRYVVPLPEGELLPQADSGSFGKASQKFDSPPSPAGLGPPGYGGAPPPQQGYGGAQGHGGPWFFSATPCPPANGAPPAYGGGFASPPASRLQPGANPHGTRGLWSWFFSVDTDHTGAITAPELKRVLFNDDWTPFDVDTVKLLMTIFNAGRLGSMSDTASVDAQWLRLRLCVVRHSSMPAARGRDAALDNAGGGTDS
ncbi:hypothetical protein C8J57DRAFT_1495082 [Mycena rebaudengoi]|nr:hypothetical protein C8J57DRAFT_1495082 [Mycena rebaudengoi]